jgi:8-oxo-dGTP pyrophosphatase MutT (NUDIX family)
MASTAQSAVPERAGVVVIRNGQVALIERVRDARRFWVVPGGSIERGEGVGEAALREAQEELGAAVRLGPLRIRLDHREEDGSFQRHWYFEAKVESDGIEMTGPELTYSPEKGSFKAVWLELTSLDAEAVIPRCVARLAIAHRGRWPDSLIVIDEHDS